ncbi:Nup133 N terminal like-domain-containing protein [Sporodiniella umbellata]|nr:Nup133 N terminal like-domain-containing protein [Sporodiniella umbellata]
METKCPEKSSNIVDEASIALESRGIVDRLFPDLVQTFSNHIVYEKAQNEKVRALCLKTVLNMPLVGLEGGSQCKLGPNSPVGIAPEIERAYFAIGKCLYLWDYVNSNDVCTYEEEDDIVSIGIVIPKTDVFNIEKVYRLMIVSTASQVKVIAISKDSTNKVRFHQTDTRTGTAGINMKSIVGTKQGRVFMLGSDGNVWELDYRQTEGWFTGKCSKKLHSSGLFSAFFLSMHDPVTQIAVNEDGTVLFQLTENSHIVTTYLGANGQDYRTVGNYSKSCESARLMCPASPLINSKDFKIVSIHPVSATESRTYQLVAITSTGCRLYYTYHQHGSNLKSEDVPNDLALIHVRTPPQPTSPPQVFKKALYKDGLFTVVKDGQQDESIMSTCPDLGKLVATNLTGRPSLTEILDEITVSGKVLAISEVSHGHTQLNELTTNFNNPSRDLLVFTTRGLTVITKQRPVDMLFNLITSTYQSKEERINCLKSFFDHFGYANTCAMCFGLIASSISLNSTIPNKPVVSQSVETAIVLLQEFSRLLSDLPSQGQQYTSRHDGLALFIYRAVQPVWDRILFTENTKNGEYSIASTLKKSDLLGIQTVLKNLVAFMDSHIVLFPKTDTSVEGMSIRGLHELAVYLTEGIAFFIYLIDTGDFTQIAQNLKPGSKELLKTINLKQLLVTPAGRSLVRDLSGALIEYTFKKQNYDTEYVISVLQESCGSFCDSSVVLLYRATHDILSARTESSSQTRYTLKSSLEILRRIAGNIPAPSLTEITTEFMFQGYPIYAIDIALSCAQARDRNNVTNEMVKSGYAANSATVELFNAKKPFYDIVLGIILEVSRNVSVNSVTDIRQEVYSTAFASKDIAFHYYIYDNLLENNAEDMLIKESPTYLEDYLNIHPMSYKRLRVLAKYYRQRDELEKAAKAYLTLGQSEGLNNQTRFEYLTNASYCAKSVVAPAKQYEMYHLLQTIGQLLESVKE